MKKTTFLTLILCIWSQNTLSNWLHDAVTNNTGLLSIKIWYKNYNINEQDKDGNTPLHLALINDREDVAQFLAEHGAHFSIKNNAQKTPHDIALEKNYTEFTNLINQIQKKRDQELIKACLQNNTKNALYYIKQGANLEIIQTSRDDTFNHFNYDSPLTLACRSKSDDSGSLVRIMPPSLELAQMLIKQGALINPNSAEIPSPLWCICSVGPLHQPHSPVYPQIAKLLIDHGAQIDYKHGNKTSLEICNTPSLAHFLIMCGADLTGTNHPEYCSLIDQDTWINNNEKREITLKRLTSKNHPDLTKALTMAQCSYEELLTLIEQAGVVDNHNAALTLLYFIKKNYNNITIHELLEKISHHKHGAFFTTFAKPQFHTTVYALQQKNKFNDIFIQHT